MQVAELVPEVSLSQGFAVRDPEVLATGERFEHRQVARAWLVQPGEHRVYGSDAALRRDDEPGPAFAGVRDPILARDRFERPHDSRPDRDDAPARRSRRVHQAGGLRRYPVELLVGGLVAFEAGHAGVQDQGRELYAAGDETRDELRRESPSGRGHLGAARLRGVDRLVVAYGPALPDVAVADREPVPVEVLVQRTRQLQGREPQPGALAPGGIIGVGGVEHRRGSFRKVQLLAGRGM